MFESLIKAALTDANKNIVVKISNKSKLLLIFKKLANLFIKSIFQIFSGSEIIVKKGINEAKEINSAIELIIIKISKRVS